MSDATVTSKGQITIPKRVREALRLQAGDTVSFDVRDDGSVLLVPRNQPIEKLFGLLKSGRGRRRLSIEEMNPASQDDLAG